MILGCPFMLFSIIRWYLRQKWWEGCLRTLYTLAELINRPSSRRWGTSHSAAPSSNSRMNTEVLEHQSSQPRPFEWGSQCQHSERVCVGCLLTYKFFHCFPVFQLHSPFPPSNLPAVPQTHRLMGLCMQVNPPLTQSPLLPRLWFPLLY